MHRSLPALIGMIIVTVILAPATAGELSHAKGFDELRERMRRVENLVFERVMTPLQMDRESARQARDISAAASELAAAAVNTARTNSTAFSSPQRRTDFETRARRLADEASVLEQIAERGSTSEIADQIQRLKNACFACHSEFRAPAVTR